jgi:general secretion pathway protein G
MTPRTRRPIRRRRRRGMSLIEIMIVLAIIGMIMGTVGVMALGRFEKAKVKTTKMKIHEVEKALLHFQTDNPEPCPKSLDDLVAGKYLSKEQLLDAWGQPLVFKCPGEHSPDGADVLSKGKDRQEGTDDDVKSWAMGGG